MIRLVDAEILCTRIFDVADGIELERCRAFIEKDATGVRRLSLRREGSEYIQLSDPPLEIELGFRRQLAVAGSPREVKLNATLYSHGAISITVRVPVTKGVTVEELIPFADELYDSPALDTLAKDEVNRLRKLLEPTFESPHLWEQNEAYAVIFVRKVEADGEGPTSEQLLACPGLARLLLGEVKEGALSKGEEREVLEHHYSYTPEDLAVIEWNAAFVYEPSGSEDIVDLLELANAQLLELRYYDAVLDEKLQRIYDVVGKKTDSLLFSPYRRALRDQMQALIELSEFLERVENALKIVGDVYLARVYEAGIAQLRLPQWNEQVSRKHKLLSQTYGLLKGEVDQGRSLTLEALVVILIVLELVMAFVRH
ncbi:MAG: hypothetical protein U0228_33255 [Myxococcaceae bacterium]